MKPLLKSDPFGKNEGLLDSKENMATPETSTWKAMENKDAVKVNPKIISDI